MKITEMQQFSSHWGYSCASYQYTNHKKIIKTPAMAIIFLLTSSGPWRLKNVGL